MKTAKYTTHTTLGYRATITVPKSFRTIAWFMDTSFNIHVCGSIEEYEDEYEDEVWDLLILDSEGCAIPEDHKYRFLALVHNDNLYRLVYCKRKPENGEYRNTGRTIN